MAVYGINKSFVCRFVKINYGRVYVPQRTGFFSSKKSKDETAASTKTKTTTENNLSQNYTLGMLKKTTSLTTKVGYKPPPNVRQIVEKVAIPYVGEENWETASLKDAAVKYKVVSKLIKEFHHDVPASCLSDMKTIDDVIIYFETEIRETSTYEDMTKLDLPKNLHIQMEYMRFNPETDTMFGGKTAFPGRDTIVSSIKHKRKYENIKNTKERPGYVNYYYGY